MTSPACQLVIGDIRIAVQGSETPLRLPPNDPHMSFLHAEDDNEADSILVWRKTNLPDFSAKAEPLFVHRSQWQIHADENGGWVLPLIFPPHQPRLRRLAIADATFSQVELSIPPDDPYADNPLACLLAELIVLGLSSRKPILLAHSACLRRGSRSLLALGQSGAGKSTLARLCRQTGGWQAIGDEIHLVTRGHVFRVHGTPWPGASGDYAPLSADLAAILILEHGSGNRLRPLSGSAAAAEILSHVFLPVWSKQAMENAATLAAAIAERLPVYRFAFSPDASAAAYLAAACAE